MKRITGLKKWFEKHFGQAGVAFYAFWGCFIVIALMGLFGLMLRWPLLFPSLGPTIILLFERGQRPAAWPCNILIGHGVAIAAGWVSVAVFGLLSVDTVIATGITPAYAGAAALSLALTAFVKHLFHAPHPPAGATTLIISLGFYTTPFQLSIMALSIVLVTLLGMSLNRLSGGRMPLWGGKSSSS